MANRNEVRYDRNHIIEVGRTYVMNNNCSVRVTSIWCDKHGNNIDYVVVASADETIASGRVGEGTWNTFYWWVDWEASNASIALAA